MSEQSVNSETALPEAVVWIDLEWVDATRTVLEAMSGEIKIVAIGGPRVAQIAELAHAWNLPHLDDPRQLLVNHPTSFWLVSSMKQLAFDDLALAMDQGTTVLSLEPFVEQMSDAGELTRKLSALRKQRKQAAGITPGNLVMLGSLVESPGYVATAGGIEMIGSNRLLRIESFGPSSERGGRSLFARLYDVWRTTLTLMPMPEKIDASLADAQLAVPGPGKLSLLSGRFAAHARIPEGGAAIIAVSDQHPDERSVVSLSGTGGFMRVTAARYELHLYETDEKEAADQLVSGQAATDLAVWQWRRLLARANFTPTDPRAATSDDVLACCHACLLSAKTREPERPEKFLRLLGT